MMKEDPFTLFKQWFNEANKVRALEANAMSLATSTSSGKPSLRTVLLKGYDETGVLFFTNYLSRKSRELDENPHAVLLFFWPELQKQVIIEGKAFKTSRQVSEHYFATRPRGSQIGAWASLQDEPLEKREELLMRYQEKEKEFLNKEVPCPPHWGGWRLEPERFEFWKGEENRLHHRLEFKKGENGEWLAQSLNP